MFEVLEGLTSFMVEINYPEINIPIYNITTLKEYKIDSIDNINGLLRLKATNNDFGEGFIQLKVKKEFQKRLFI